MRALAVLAGLLLASSSVGAQTTPRQVKAAFLTKFGQFVQWPIDLAATRRSFDVCLSVGHPFGPNVETLSSGVQAHGLDLVVREVSRPDMLAGCQVLYVSRPNGEDRPLLERAAAMPILTVGDDDSFLTRGGIVNLREVGDRVRFDVSLRNAEHAGLQLNSQLLRLARTIQGAN